MRIKLEQIKLTLDESLEKLQSKAAKVLGIPAEAIENTVILRESLDARKKEAIVRVYTLAVTVKSGVRVRGTFQPYKEESFESPDAGTEKLSGRPVIIGMGPAGLMAGYLLAEQGYKPLILERGQDVDTRTVHVKAFWDAGLLDTESNVQFGEGGAGTFSDGKLTCRSRDIRSNWFFQKLVETGAPPEILYQAKPHVGTDKLKEVVKSLRGKILELGGDIRFGERVAELITVGNTIRGVITSNGERIESDAVILAIGHSARDTFEALADQGVTLTPKPFAVGFRIEHPQAMIDTAQYGSAAGHPFLGAADYHLTHQSAGGRAVYTFCMCPGGHVVGAASETEHLVVNGMSYHARNGINANSALLVTVNPQDYEPGPLGGIAFQRKIERGAYLAGGGGYKAPVQRATDFLENIPSTSLEGLAPSHQPGVLPGDLGALLPEALTEALREGLKAMGQKLRGFSGSEAVLTGVETRSSSPVRINRDSITMESVSHSGLYPTGEGAGYAGGIVSSAVDGILTAECIIRKFARPE
jgi:uncharacterized FAD-dependent dehydrogenase